MLLLLFNQSLGAGPGAASTPNTLGVRVDAAPEDTANVVSRRISQPSS